MKLSSNKTISTFLQHFIEKFENKILNDKEESQHSGIVYTPIEVADFIVRNIFKIYIEEFLENFSLKSTDIFFADLDTSLIIDMIFCETVSSKYSPVCDSKQ